VTDTLPITSSFRSDTDNETPIYSTMAYKTYKNLDIEGPKEYMAFTHVRINPRTVQLREKLLQSQGENNTYFAGGWSQGMMLHEDALVSGINVASSILTSCDQDPIEVLRRKTELPSDIQHPTPLHYLEDSSEVGTVATKILSIMADECDIHANLQDTIGSLGLMSTDIALVHSCIQDEFHLDDNSFPVTLFLETATSLGDLATTIEEASGVTHSSHTPPAGSFESEVFSLFEKELGRRPSPKDTLASLNLASIKIASIHGSLMETFRLHEDVLPVSTFFDSENTVGDLIGIIKEVSVETSGDGQFGGTGRAHHSATRPASITDHAQLEPYVPPTTVAVVSCIMQIVSLLIPAIYVAASIAPAAALVSAVTYQYAILLAPVVAIVYTTSCAVVLILMKWVVLGRLRPGHTAVWGSKFAQRWIVRACCRACFRYSPWRFMNGTEMMSTLQRCLGCKLGKGAYINHDCIDDFDLVTVGNGSTVEGFLNPSDVSVGVLTLAPIRVGCHCRLDADCLIEMGSTIDEAVHVAPRCLVVRDSKLSKGTRWHGKPATEEHVEYTEKERCDGPSKEPLSNAPNTTRSMMFKTTTMITLFVISPYLSSAEIVLIYYLGRLIFDGLGWVGLGVLVWVPVTVTGALASALSVCAKKVLLGVVREGKWPLFGSFHRRKYVVDHLVQCHMLVWLELATLVGSPVAVSTAVQSFCWRALGGKMDSDSVCSPQISWTCYDLVQIGSKNMFGGGSKVLPWSSINEYLVSKAIRTGSDVYVGTNASVLGGVTLEDGATVAGASVAFTNVARGETVIGIKNVGASLLGKEKALVGSDTQKILVAGHLSGILIWFCAGALVACCGLYATRFWAHVVNVPTSVVPIIVACAIGASLYLLLPLYAALLCVLSKYLLVGTSKTGQIERDSLYMIRHWTALTFGPIRDSLVSEVVGGTFLETSFYRTLGATIGTNVFFDSIYLFEPDLLEVGNHSSIGLNTCLSPHQITRTEAQAAVLRVGKRCTTGFNAVLHGRDVLEDDGTLSGLSMPFIGTRLKKGAWSGYPAQRRGPVHQPKMPNLPAWYIFLLNPCSSVVGLFWWVALAVGDLCFGCFKLDFEQEKEFPNSSSSCPAHFSGVYEATTLPVEIRLDRGKWLAQDRCLVLDVGTYAKAHQGFRGAAWCRFAGYTLSFDQNLGEAIGRVHLGWWQVPVSIVCLRVRRSDERSWTAGHSWFRGDPQEEIHFEKVL